MRLSKEQARVQLQALLATHKRLLTLEYDCDAAYQAAKFEWALFGQEIDLFIEACGVEAVAPIGDPTPPNPGYAGVALQQAARQAEVSCTCFACLPDRVRLNYMVVCPRCGAKRCSHATNHIFPCTNSNTPGQPGSRYK